MSKQVKAKKVGPVRIEALKHKDDQRTNIPTAELETFLNPEDRESKRVMYARPSDLLYPRNPSLIPS